MRATTMAIALAFALAAPAAAQQQSKVAVMYKAEGCGCCDGHADHLRASGYQVRVVELADLDPIKRKHGVAEKFQGCHTLEVGGYVVEGHVPAKVIDKLLAEKPAIKGVSLPGMPDGSPGMSGTKAAPFTIYDIGTGKVFAVE
jgi:hypothetical protein